MTWDIVSCMFVMANLSRNLGAQAWLRQAFFIDAATDFVLWFLTRLGYG